MSRAFNLVVSDQEDDSSAIEIFLPSNPQFQDVLRMACEQFNDYHESMVPQQQLNLFIVKYNGPRKIKIVLRSDEQIRKYVVEDAFIYVEEKAGSNTRMGSNVPTPQPITTAASLPEPTMDEALKSNLEVVLKDDPTISSPRYRQWLAEGLLPKLPRVVVDEDGVPRWPIDTSFALQLHPNISMRMCSFKSFKTCLNLFFLILARKLAY